MRTNQNFPHKIRFFTYLVILVLLVIVVAQTKVVNGMCMMVVIFSLTATLATALSLLGPRGPTLNIAAFGAIGGLFVGLSLQMTD